MTGICLWISSLCMLLVVAISSAECPAGFVNVAGSNACFILLKRGGLTKDTRTTWSGAQQRCSEAGLRLAAPSNTIAVELSRLLLTKYGTYSPAWVNAQGDGVDKFTWQQQQSGGGGSIHCGHPLMPDSACNYAGTNKCLFMRIHQPTWEERPEKPYGIVDCNINGCYALCQQE